MEILITGAAGNLGSFLARACLGGPHSLRLMVHRTPIPEDLACQPGLQLVTADLARPQTLDEACRGVDCIVHFAGVLFRPFPGRFLPTTNTVYTQNLVDAAVRQDVGRFILISFPHVEGPSDPDHPALGRLDGQPDSVHARTRLAAELAVLARCAGSGTQPVVLRPGMIYGQGVLMIEAARWLAQHRLLGVWRRPTWIHLLSLPDFLRAVVAAIALPGAHGVYNLGDDEPLTLQAFLDLVAKHWGSPRPWRAPAWAFFLAGWLCEGVAAVLGTPAPLTRDFIRIGRASYVSDTNRMRQVLLPELAYPTIRSGIEIL